MFAKNKALGNKVQRFSIRKLSVGAASVLIGLAFTGWGTQTVKADEQNPTATTQQVAEVQKQKATDNSQSGTTTETKASDETNPTPAQKQTVTDQSAQTNDDVKVNDKLSTDNKLQNGGVKPTLVTKESDHQAKVNEQKLEIAKPTKAPT